MRALIKLGGTLLDDSDTRTRLAKELAALTSVHELAIVHGGGKQMTQYLAERGVESRFVDGMRVTTPEVVDALLKVFAGSVNHQLVASLTGAGAKAVGLTGIDAGLAIAEQLDPRLGAVGRIIHGDAGLLHCLVGGGYLPVVACVAGSVDGQIFNVNADRMAVACARAFSVDRLIFLTDVEGVRGEAGTTLPRLSLAECRDLVERNIATGGMQAKLEAACEAVAGSGRQVIIAPGARPGAAAAILSGETLGTAVHA